jgi:hypothetical protein
MDTNVIKRKTLVINDEDDDATDSIQKNESSEQTKANGKLSNTPIKKSETNKIENNERISHSNGSNKIKEITQDKIEKQEKTDAPKRVISIEERIKMLKAEKDEKKKSELNNKSNQKPNIKLQSSGSNIVYKDTKLNLQAKPPVKKLEEKKSAPSPLKKQVR